MHNSLVRVAVRAKEQMPEFVGDGAAQDYWSLKLSIVTLGATPSKLIIDTGENRVDCETEDGVLKHVCDRCTQYP